MRYISRGISWLNEGLSDRAALYSLGNSLRAIVAGPLTAYLIASRFSKETQGYYYTFGSFLGLQVFAELGLGTVITQFASHEWARLSLRDGRVEGDQVSRSRLAGLLHFSLRWYAVAGGAVLFPLGAFGWYFFQSSPGLHVNWKGPWIALCLAATFRLMLTPAFAVLDGCGQVAQAYGFRLADGLIMVATTWVAILLGFNLWTGAVVIVTSLASALLFLRVCYKDFFSSIANVQVREKIHWREEVLPMQWRMALSWLSGYFLFQLFTPVLFRYRGAREAGQFGLTWNMVSSINSIGSAFLQTQSAGLGALVATGDFSELNRRVRRALGFAVLGTVAGSMALLALLKVLDEFYPSLSERCLGLGPSAILLIATVLMQISYAQAVYLRAFKREPFLWLSLLSGAVCGVLTWLLGSHYGARGVVWGYLGVVIVVTIPVGTWLFSRRRREWTFIQTKS